MTDFEISPDENSNRIDVLEAKINMILMFTGGQFVAILALIINSIN